MNKAARQETIKALIREQPVATLTKLQAELSRRGTTSTLPTLSRDIAELGVVKLGGRYHVSADLGGDTRTEPLRQSHFRQFIVSYEAVENMVSIRTKPGTANAVAIQLDAHAELIDSAGTIAGDDTIFVLLRSSDSARRTVGWLDSMVG